MPGNVPASTDAIPCVVDAEEWFVTIMAPTHAIGCRPAASRSAARAIEPAKARDAMAMPHAAQVSTMLGSLIDRIRVSLSRAGLRYGEYSGNYDRLARLYRQPDLWNLANAGDRVRFEETNRRIVRLSPDCPSLLELGAGEGLQTGFLTHVANRVTAIELSPEAIGRARRQVPDAHFLNGRAEDLSSLVQGQRFAVATACEMLYYVRDPGAVLAALQQVADRIVVTNYARLDHKVAFLFDGPGWHRDADIRHGRTCWHCYHWQAPRRHRTTDIAVLHQGNQS